MASRRWCFTLNNPSGELSFNDLEHVRYAIWQREKGDSGTEHYQGYIELRKPQRFSYFAGVLAGAHFESSKGSREQARQYCRKEESRLEGPFEHGVWEEGGQGTRSDLQQIQQRILDGGSERDIADEFFADYCRYGTGIRRYIQLRSFVQPRSEKTIVTVLYGKPGTGKSHFAMERGAKFIVSSSNYPWFDGYDGHSNVLIDDFYGWIKFHHMLVLLDKYPCKVQVKGGMLEWAPKEIFITSNSHPDDWYNDAKLDVRALKRRIENIIHKDEIYTPLF